MNTPALRAITLVTLLTAAEALAAVGPSLAAKQAKAGGHVNVVVLLESVPNVVSRATYGRPSAANENARTLRDTHEGLISGFLSRASSRGIQLNNPESFWIGPAVSARVELSQISLLESIPGVAMVIDDATVELLNPVRTPAPAQAADATAAAFDLLGVRTLWQRGLTGRGTLVASLDTGVDGLHPALKARFRGNRVGAAASWRDPLGGTAPNDSKGHGTHTMGTVLGCEPGDTVGVAPEAEWIAAGVVDRGRTLSQTISDLLGAFQWLADPDGNPETQSDRPDVVLNSWGIPRGVLPDCDATFWQAVDHLEALGTVVVFAAGNEGPGPVTLRQPADRGDLPLGCFSVGAVSALEPNLGASPFSSRGPTSCGSSVIKPEIVAPGVNVRSCNVGGGYKLLSGTSMAAPYVAGAICLLRQYNPDATPQQLKEALVRSAHDVGPAGPDFETGYGVLNVAGALDVLTPGAPLSLEVSLKEFSNEPAAAGVTAHGELRIDNLGRSLEELSVTIRPRSEGCTVSGELSRYVDFVSGGDGTLTMPLSLSSAEDMLAGDRLWADLVIKANSPRLDTSITVGLLVGQGPRRSAMAVSHDGLSMIAANTARFDAEGADAISVLAQGFSYDGVQIPFTGGLQISSRSRQVSSFGDNDFEPAGQELQATPAPRVLAQSRFRDTRNPDPVGVECESRVEAGLAGPGSYLLAKYTWRRLWAGEAIQPGSWFNWQPASGAIPVATSGEGEICFSGDGVYFGSVWLSRSAVSVGYAPYDPSADALPAPGNALPAAGSTWSFFRESAQAASDGQFAIAFVAGRTKAEWQDAASRARRQYSAGAGLDEPVTPLAFELHPSYPNPFNPSTTISFTLEQETVVKLEIFNTLGRRVCTPLEGRLPAGLHRVIWDAGDDFGVPLPTGLYLLRVTAEGEVRTGKVTLLR